MKRSRRLSVVTDLSDVCSVPLWAGRWPARLRLGGEPRRGPSQLYVSGFPFGPFREVGSGIANDPS